MRRIKLYIGDLKPQNNDNWNYVFPLIECLLKKNEKLLKFYELVESIEKADYFALSFSVEYLYAINKEIFFLNFIKLAKENQKEVLVFTSGDFGKTILDDNVIMIRLGGFKSKMPNRTFIMPPFIEDPLLTLQEKLTLIEYVKTPSLGFVGHSSKGIKKYLKEMYFFARGNLKRIFKKDFTDFQFFYPSSIKRYLILSELKKSVLIKTDFIFREKYRAGAVSKENRIKTTLEFFLNIKRNPYTFCMRGSGNFSVRFYETLALGRIPFFINTDCKLPFEDTINWKQHIVTIDETNLGDMENRVTNFHSKFSNKTFLEIQNKNRELWEKIGSKESFFECLYFEILKKK